jgi:acyl dehydratase
MSLDLSAVGHTTDPFYFEYDWKTVVLYNLGVGCRQEDLDYLYEARGPKVVPSFAVVPSYPALVPLVERARADMSRVVHGGQSIVLHAPIPSAGRLETVARVEAIYDLKRFAYVVFKATTKCKGTVLFETEWTLVVRDTGGFDGPRPPKTSHPKAVEGADPAFDVQYPTTKEQALLYRLSGDYNPLHADPEFARAVGFDQGPILHGLCTFGVLTRAVVAGPCQGQPERLRSLTAQFKKPVWPGEALRTVLHRANAPDTFVLSTYAADRPDAVVGGAWATVSPS